MITIHPPKSKYGKATPERLLAGLWRNVRLSWPTDRSERYQAFLALRCITNCTPKETVRVAKSLFARHNPGLHGTQFVEDERYRLFLQSIPYLHRQLDIEPSMFIDFSSYTLYGNLYDLGVLLVKTVVPGSKEVSFKRGLITSSLAEVMYQLELQEGMSVQVQRVNKEYFVVGNGFEARLTHTYGKYLNGEPQGELVVSFDGPGAERFSRIITTIATQYCFAQYWPDIAWSRSACF